MKKIIILLLTLVLALTVFVVTASAAGATATVDNKSCAKGGSVTLNVSVSGASSVLSGAVEVVYDDAILELVSASWNTEGALLSTFDKTTNMGAFAFQSAKSLSGKIFSVTFKVLENAPIGKTTVECRIQLKNNSGDISVTNKEGSVSATCNHSFTEKTDRYLASSASCTSPATYYYTCSICGERGTTTYNVGSSTPHTFDRQVATSNYLVTSVTCVNEGEYYYSCSCGQKGTEKFVADTSWSHNYSANWFIGSDSHWHQCTICKEKKDISAHTPTADGVCSICQFVVSGQEVHSHAFSASWERTEDAHWHECSCGLKSDLALHTWNDGENGTDGNITYTCTACSETKTVTLAHEHIFSTVWSRNEDTHWHECSCGLKSDLSIHTWNDGVKGSNGNITYTCTACSKSKVATPVHEHTFSIAWNRNEDTHWHECSCGLKSDLALHTWNNGVSGANGNITYTCTACSQRKTVTPTHEHAFSASWNKNEDAHWHECSCGLKSDLALHTWNNGVKGTDGNITYTCTACSQRKTVTPTHEHAFSSSWNKNKDAHWHECSCGLKNDLELHSWDEGVVKTPATEKKEGEKLFTCLICAATKKEAIEKIKADNTNSNENTNTNMNTNTSTNNTTTDSAGFSVMDIVIVAIVIVGAVAVIEVGVFVIIKATKKNK